MGDERATKVRDRQPTGLVFTERPGPAMHIIRRADGESFDGEYAFFATDGPTGWDVAENADHDEDTVYEILACYPVARRKFLSSTLCPTCDGEGDGCPACAGTGEHEPPEAETLDPFATPGPSDAAPDPLPEIRSIRQACIEAANDPDTVGSAATYDLIANRDQDGAR